MSSKKNISVKKAIDSEDNHRRRNDSSISVRKEKKQEHLQKRRGIGNESGEGGGVHGSGSQFGVGVGDTVFGGSASVPVGNPAATGSKDQVPLSVLMTPEALEESRTNLYSDDHTLVQKAAQNLRRILSIEKNPPIQMVIQAGLVPQLVSLLQHDQYPIIQFEAAWALTNIASGSSNDTRAVVDSAACPQLIRLLGSKSEDVREQCAWALGNVAGDSLQCRDLVLSLGCLPALLTIFNERSRISTIRNSTWTLSNLFRGKPPPSIANVQQALPCLASLIFSHDVETVTDACWALSYISDGTNDKIQMVLDTNVAPKLVELLNSGNAAVQTPALRAIGNIVTGNDAQTQAVINLGILPAISSLLTHEKKNIRKEACWTLSNITAGTKDQIQCIIDCEDTIPRLIEVLRSADFDVQKEACWALANATSGGTEIQILQIAMAGAIPPMCNMLSAPDNKIIQVALEGLDNILKAAKRYSDANHSDTLTQVVEAFHTTGGIATIEALQQHELMHISGRAMDMIGCYFMDPIEDDDEDDEEDIAPDATGDQFGFNGGNSGGTGFNF